MDPASSPVLESCRIVEIVALQIKRERATPNDNPAQNKLDVRKLSEIGLIMSWLSDTKRVYLFLSHPGNFL